MQENKENVPPINSQAKCTIISQIVVKEESAKSKLQDFNPSKSTSSDRIQPYVLKELSEELALPLTILASRSLNEKTPSIIERCTDNSHIEKE